MRSWWPAAIGGCMGVALVAVAAWWTVTGEGKAELAGALAWAIPLALILAIAGALLARQRGQAPVRQLASAASELSLSGHGRRLPISPADDPETIELTKVINGMLGKMEGTLDQARRFSSDAAHELKTPLTILLGHLQAAAHDALPNSPEEARLLMLVDEVNRMQGLISGLLFLARVDAGLQLPGSEPVDLSAMLNAACEDLEAVADNLAVTADVATDLQVRGTRTLLQQAIQNLLGNAMKYNRTDGWIRIHAQRSGDRILCRVSNAGNGIPADKQAQIFDRFFRLDESRSRIIDGHGLGLSLAREIILSHNGDLLLESGDTDNVTFCINLPAASHTG